MFRPQTMFRPSSPNAKITIIIIVIVIVGIALGVVVGLLRSGGAAAPYAVGVLGSLVALFQWLIAEWRARAKVTWEAVQTYYTDGDDKKFVNIRERIRQNDSEGAEDFCNFYEKWGRLARLGYLPVKIFNGSSGASISLLFLRLEGHIVSRRKEDNPHYAQSYVWLVSEIHRLGYLKGLPAEAQIADLARRLGVRTSAEA